jgi:CRISPR-associated protein Csm4
METTSERLHSDTLFSAWISSYARLTDRTAVARLLQGFTEGELPFRLSSTFIFRQLNGRTIYYLPHPLKSPPGYRLDDSATLGKAIKKLKFLPLEVWQRWYQGAGFDEGDRTELLGGKPDTSRESLTELGTFDYSDAFQFQTVPKVSIDRITRATNFYHTGFVQYHWQSNLAEPEGVESLSGQYFLVYFPQKDPELENTFFAVLDFLGGEGIGGERSSGAGQFKIDADAKTQELPPQWQSVVDYTGGPYHCLMSLFWQRHLPEALLENASYGLKERGGWITSPVSDGRQLRRKAIQMFTEGSVFSAPPAGNLADVTPENEDGQPKFRDHPIYRSGISLSLPMNVQEGQ